MAKWADYLISGIWQIKTNTSTYISHVFLHKDNGNTVGKGSKLPRTDIVKLIKAGKSIQTITWNYTTASWSKGADVDCFKTNGVEYIRSHKDGTVNDNLDNLIRMNNIL